MFASDFRRVVEKSTPGESRRSQHDDMKQKSTGLSQQDAAALVKHLKPIVVLFRPLL
jgi:hypothetical protein